MVYHYEIQLKRGMLDSVYTSLRKAREEAKWHAQFGWADVYRVCEDTQATVFVRGFDYTGENCNG